MFFKYVREVQGEANCYGKSVKTGDVVEFTGHLENKALSNPDWEETEKPVVKKAVKKVVKKAVKKAVKKTVKKK